MGTTAVLSPGQLVVFGKGRSQRSATVLPTVVLDNDSLSTELTDAGWRLAEFTTAGFRVLARATSEHRSGFIFDVVEVEIAYVETGVKEIGDTFAIIVELGTIRRWQKAVARVDALDRSTT